MPNIIKTIAERLGYQISKIGNSTIPNGNAGLYFCALLGAIAARGKLRIVQIGANDGATGDPLHNFIREHAERTEIILVEPQEFLVPILRENYKFHAGTFVFNGAVGKKGTLELFAVDPAYWPKLNVPYATRKGWPLYRAPSGITSSSKEHVSNWLQKFLPRSTDPENVIRQFSVPCLPLLDLLATFDLLPQVDVLQVDVEGADDEVIYQCDIATTAPAIIYFETEHLSMQRQVALSKYLEEKGYRVWRLGGNSLALAGYGKPGSGVQR